MEYLIGGYVLLFVILLAYLWSLRRREMMADRDADLLDRR